MSKSTKNLNYGTFPVAVICDELVYGGYNDRTHITRTTRYAHPPLKSAAASAEVFLKSIRLSPADLLADAAFIALARKAALKDKAFTTDLLAWEKKDVVSAAVAVVRAQVDAERREAARVAAIAEAARLAKLAEEAPVRNTVVSEYRECGYRTCTQGHSVSVAIGEKVGVSADTHNGDLYSSRCTYRKLKSTHTIYVRPDWLARVRNTGGAIFGDRSHPWSLVLDAEAVGCLTDLTPVYEIRVVKQTAGTGLAVETLTATVNESGEWVELPKRVAAKAVRLPAAIIADYLEDRGVPTEDVMPLRAGCC